MCVQHTAITIIDVTSNLSNSHQAGGLMHTTTVINYGQKSTLGYFSTINYHQGEFPPQPKARYSFTRSTANLIYYVYVCSFNTHTTSNYCMRDIKYSCDILHIHIYTQVIQALTRLNSNVTSITTSTAYMNIPLEVAYQ